MKTVHKVRATVVDTKGRAYAIVADEPHVLQLPGGSRKPDEDPIKALRREIAEETGFKIRIVRLVKTITVVRCGVREITRCYLAEIIGRVGKPRLTKAEAARGLRVQRYRSVKALRRDLADRVERYGRSACRRDHALIMAV